MPRLRRSVTPYVDAERVSEISRPADWPHPTQHALLLHILLCVDPVRGQERARRQHCVLVVFCIATALFVVLQDPFGWTADQFGRKPQLLVWSGAIALLIVPVSTPTRRGRLRFGAAGVLLRSRSLRDEKSSIAPAIMSELFPTRLRGLGIGAWYNLTVASLAAPLR